MRNTAAECVAAPVTHVAVAAIVNERQQVLVSLRPEHVHQGGLWEFPGGKLEAGESVQAALKREIHEELGVSVTRARPLIRIPHRYPDKAVLLDVWRVDAFQGDPHGREGQVVEWLPIDALAARAFPAANRPIIRALQLPLEYLITPEPDGGAEPFLQQLCCSLETGVRLVQLRAKSLSPDAYEALARQAIELWKGVEVEKTRFPHLDSPIKPLKGPVILAAEGVQLRNPCGLYIGGVGADGQHFRGAEEGTLVTTLDEATIQGHDYLWNRMLSQDR